MLKLTSGRDRTRRPFNPGQETVRLDGSLADEHHRINLPRGEEIPFIGLVEKANVVSQEHHGGDPSVYCGDNA